MLVGRGCVISRGLYNLGARKSLQTIYARQPASLRAPSQLHTRANSKLARTKMWDVPQFLKSEDRRQETETSVITGSRLRSPDLMSAKCGTSHIFWFAK